MAVVKVASCAMFALSEHAKLMCQRLVLNRLPVNSNVFLWYKLKSCAVKTALHPQSANGAIPSKLCTKSSSLKMYATTEIDFTLKMPFPIAVRICPLAARKIANGDLCGRESCTFDSKSILTEPGCP